MYRSRFVLPLVALTTDAAIVAVGATTTTLLPEEEIVEVQPSFAG